jgi:hypothetical protein
MPTPGHADAELPERVPVDVFDTLQVPIQLPVSPDGRFVGVAVLSLTTVARPCTGSSDHIAIIDTATDTVVKFLGVPTEAGKANGAHGANFGAKLGGGHYLHVASQFSNKLTVVDLDPQRRRFRDGRCGRRARAARERRPRWSPYDGRRRRSGDQAAAERLRRVGAGHSRPRSANRCRSTGLDRPVDAVPERSRRPLPRSLATGAVGGALVVAAARALASRAMPDSAEGLCRPSRRSAPR